VRDIQAQNMKTIFLNIWKSFTHAVR
jgi:hypothetical protein